MCKKEIRLIALTSFVLVLGLAAVGWSGASKPIPANGAVYQDVWANIGWTPGKAAASFDVYFGDNLEDVKNGTGEAPRGNQAMPSFIVGFVGFPYPGGLVPGTTYYWRIDEIQTDGTIHTGPVWSFSITSRTATKPVPADEAQVADPAKVVLGWSPGFGAKLHTVYFGGNFEDVNNASGGVPQGALTYNPGPLDREKVYYWRVDEFDVINTYKGKVWSFTTPGAVGNFQPADGAVDVQATAKLTWTPAETASSHHVYFGTDGQAVKNATTASPEYKGSKSRGDEVFDPGELIWDTAYYWRVDAVYDADPANPVKGLVCGFTTADFLVVDDFESYDDVDPIPGQLGVNRIFDKWIDGFGTTTNGALVGNEMPPYAEQTIVHTGVQSMKYFYDNDNKTSEATLTLVSPRDWTQNDVNTLTLYFRGDVGNSAEQMYFALNGSAVVYHDDPGATQIPLWLAWNIELKAFADQGVNLANVNTISIGLGNKGAPQAGGSGTMYFDDIRLAREPAPAGRVLLLAENFDGVTLGPNVEEGGAGTVQQAWTDTPPDGWVVDESGVPGVGDPAVDGVTEWAGWAFADKDFWVNTDGQRREEFNLGQGVVAVADGDEWDDSTHPAGYSPAVDAYDTWLSTPEIDISGIQPGTVRLEFDSSWRPEFDSNYHQTANITASYNGGDPVEILLWESDSASPNYKSDESTNESIVVDVDNPPWATSVVLTFGYFDAGNDWWWAIDNIKISGIAK